MPSKPQKGFAPIAVLFVLAILIGGLVLYNQTRKATPEQVTKTETKWLTFTSEELGVAFEYPDFARVRVEGNKIYVGEEWAEQYVELFTKKAEDYLGSLIQSQFITTPEQKKYCVTTGTITDNESTFHRVGIKYDPALFDETGTLKEELVRELSQGNLPSCGKYSSDGGGAYFQAFKDYPNRFAFFSLGQICVSDCDSKQWYETFRFTK